MLRFAIPSKGALYDGTLAFLESAGLKVSRLSPKRYTASIRTLAGADVLLHRPGDVVTKVAEGSIDLGVTGLDLYEELRGDHADLLLLYDDLGYGRCELVLAVPEAWIDVSSWDDIADLAVELGREGRPLRIATKFPNLVRQACYAYGVNVFRLVDSQGATEAAPGLGYADVIADITETGTALRDNQLKIVGEPILRSAACLIGSRRSLRSPAKRAIARTVLELIEARRRARLFFSVVANVQGMSVEDVGVRVTARPELAGLQGPTIAPVWDKGGDGGWYAITVVVPQDELMAAVDHLRRIGASSLTVLPVQYVFNQQSDAYARLEAALG